MTGTPLDGLQEWIRGIVREEVRCAIADLAGPQIYLSTSEAAEIARVTPGTIRRWVREGRLQGAGAGRDVRVRREELQGIMAPGRRRAPRRDPQTVDALSLDALSAKIAARLGA